MSRSPKISIIIPSFNKGVYIGKTIQSIIKQKYPRIEIIIQDGGSTDSTLSVIKKFKKKYPEFLFWESKKDRGQKNAVNIGMSKAKGDLVAYLNADDIYLDGSLKKVAASFLKNKKSLWFVGKGIVIDGNDAENQSFIYKIIVKPYKNLLLKANRYNLLLCTNYIMQPSVFLNRIAVKRLGLFKGTKSFVTEYDYWLNLGRKEMPEVIESDISGFRMAGDNITSLKTKELLKADYILVKKYTSNPLILIFHLVNNLGRVISLSLINVK